jgi:hypothetical protein
VLFCHITSRVATDKHQELLKEKGGQGFPYLVFMDSDGNVLAKHSGARSIKGFEATGGKAVAYMEVKKKAEGGDKAAQIDLVLAEMDLGKTTLEEGQKKLKELGELSKEQQAKLDGIATNATVMEIVKPLRRNDKQGMIDAGKKFFDMKKEGKIPSGDQEFQMFWILMMDYAESVKDAKTFEEGFTSLKTKFGDTINKQWAQQNEERLKKLKEAKEEH